MKTRLVTIPEDASVYDAAVKMKEKDVGSLLVADGKGRVYGLVTDEDLVRKAIVPKRMNAKIRELASKPLLGISPDEDISAAAREMGARNVKRLVVFRNKEVVGLISAADIVRISPSLYDLISEKEHIAHVTYASTR